MRPLRIEPSHHRATARFATAISFAAVCACVSMLLPASSAAAQTPRTSGLPGVNVYLSAPTVQGTDAAGAVMETFNGSPISNPQMGTWNVSTPGGVTGSFNWSDPDTWGGASATDGTPTTGGVGSKYVRMNISDVTVQFPGPQKFAGFWWSGGSPTDAVTFYRGSTEVARFTSSMLTELLASPTVTSLGGSTYDPVDYQGNPRNGAGTPYPFVYLNLAVSGGVTFDSAKFTAGNFEMDNLARSEVAFTPPASLVDAGFIPGFVVDEPLPLAVNDPRPAKKKLPRDGSAILVKSIESNSAANVKVSLSCKPPRASRGDIRNCSYKVNRAGRVKVFTYGQRKLKVKLTIRATPKSEGSGYTSAEPWVRTWRVR